MTVAERLGVGVGPDDLGAAVADAIGDGGRLVALLAIPRGDGATRLRALIARAGRLEAIDALLPASMTSYRSVSALVPAARWYEQEIHDLFGLVPVGHPYLGPLVFPLSDHHDGGGRPRPGRPEESGRLVPDVSARAGHVSGEGVFTIPYGPVRSGVFETMEYLVETVGEDIPLVRIHPFVKHRGIARRFADLDVADGVLLAERVEGVASVAHAMAFSEAVERLAGVEVPPAAQFQRAVHAELERIANHLDSVIRHTEGAGQAVAYARLTFHKERVLRLQAKLCGSRFGRGVVVPGGTSGPPRLPSGETLAMLDGLEADVTRDLRALMATPSFLDRLRGTGVVAPETAARYGAVGPVGRASTCGEDLRVDRPYGAYRQLGAEAAVSSGDGDALARQWVRVQEIRSAWRLIRASLDELTHRSDGPYRAPIPAGVEGEGVGWVEAPQGELLYVVEADAGRLRFVKPCTPSFHNFVLFPEAFGGDVLTDFVFIEASFGVSLAGVAG